MNKIPSRSNLEGIYIPKCKVDMLYFRCCLTSQIRQQKYSVQNLNTREPRKSKSANHIPLHWSHDTEAWKFVSSCPMAVALIAALMTDDGTTENISTLLLVLSTISNILRGFIQQNSVWSFKWRSQWLFTFFNSKSDETDFLPCSSMPSQKGQCNLLLHF